MKKVVKFGGSSLASAAQFEKVGAIIREDESRRYVVPSAPGKRFSEDTKVTDLLYACYRSVGDEERFHKILDEINKCLTEKKISSATLKIQEIRDTISLYSSV